MHQIFHSFFDIREQPTSFCSQEFWSQAENEQKGSTWNTCFNCSQNEYFVTWSEF